MSRALAADVVFRSRCQEVARSRKPLPWETFMWLSLRLTTTKWELLSPAKSFSVDRPIVAPPGVRQLRSAQATIASTKVRPSLSIPRRVLFMSRGADSLPQTAQTQSLPQRRLVEASGSPRHYLSSLFPNSIQSTRPPAPTGRSRSSIKARPAARCAWTLSRAWPWPTVANRVFPDRFT